VKKSAVFLAIVVLLVVVIGCQTGEVEVARVVTEKETVVEMIEVTPTFDAEAEKEKLEAVHNAIIEAFASEDRDAIRRLYHPDFTFHWSDGKTVVDLVLNHPWVDTFPAQTFILEDPKWIVITPDLAVRTGYAISWVVSEGPGEDNEMMFATDVFIKEDGQWLYLHGHNSRSGRKWNGP
jgi:hypothetical protein